MPTPRRIYSKKIIATRLSPDGRQFVVAGMMAFATVEKRSAECGYSLVNPILPSRFVAAIQSICHYWATNETKAVYEKISGQYPANAKGIREYLVGDVHGDLNHLVGNLVESGAANFKAGAPTTLFFDTVTRQTSTTISDLVKTDGNAWGQLRMIPNLEFNREFSNHITFLGDVLDRGEFSDECLCTLIHLFDQQARAIANPERWKMHWVFADHEIYALMPVLNFNIMPFNPHYMHLQTPRTRSDCPVSVAHLLRDAVNAGYIEYTRIGTNGVLFGHSFLTPGFLEAFLVELKSNNPTCARVSQAGEGLDVMAAAGAIGHLQAVDRDAKKFHENPAKLNALYGWDYNNSLEVLVRHLNGALKAAVNYGANLDPNNPNFASQMLELTDLHMFIPPDDHSPIFARTHPLLIPQAVGHTRQNDGRVRHVGGGAPETVPVYFFDTASSYAYNRQRSRPRIACIEPNGEISSGKMPDEASNPAFNVFSA